MQIKTTKKCKTCGKEFKLFRTTDRYCSPECVENKLQKKSVAPIKPVSDKMTKELAKYRRLRSQYLEATPTCEVRGCNRGATDIHHKKSRGIYLCVVEYFLAVCRPCHQRIEMDVNWSKENGYSVNRLSDEI